MSRVVRCPACEREFRAKSELVGRRVRCPSCTTPFAIAVETADADLAALAGGAAVEREVSAAARRGGSVQAASGAYALAHDRHESSDTRESSPAASKPPRPFVRPAQAWTAGDHLLFRTGVGCILFGIGAVMLPAFGLQFRKLQNLGGAAPAAGWTIVALGAILCAYVTVLKGRMLRGLLILSSVGLVLLTALIIAVVIIGSRPPPRPPSPSGPPPGQAYSQPGLPAETAPEPADRQPGRRPDYRSSPPGAPPRPTAPRDAPTYESLSARYGASRVARIKLVGLRGLELAPVIRAKLPALLGVDVTPSSRLSTRGDQGDLLVAPVADFEAFVKGLDLGPISELNRDARSATIAVDRSRVMATP